MCLLALAVACCFSWTAGARSPRHATLPIATHDGTLILFESDRDGRGQLYSMNADGSSERHLIDSKTFDFGADWSADVTAPVSGGNIEC
jgi:Tol biopolymer transport system component